VSTPATTGEGGTRGPWAQLSLRARLLAVVAALLTVALVAVGVLTVTNLRGQLLKQVDAQLRSVVQERGALEQLVDQLQTRGGGPIGDDPLPSRYVVEIFFDDPAVRDSGPLHDGPEGPLPRLPDLTRAQADATDGAARTVRGSDGTSWRMVAVPVVDQSARQPGAAVIALPLDDVQETLRAVALRFVVLGAALIALLVLIGWFLVGRAFRPLREVESVTAAFGEGDTSRRVDVRAPGTEVGRLGGAVNAMLDRIETTLAAREASEQRMRRFIGDAGHELRTPLATLRGFAELYRMGAVSEPDDVSGTFRRIEDESTRMGGLVEDLLVLARLDEQRPLRQQDVDLLVLAGDAVHDSTALAPDRVVRLTGIDGSPRPQSAPTTGDEARLRQVVTNLLGNALRHTPQGTPVELGVGRREDRCVLQVVDHGPGVPPELAEKIFERFYRADASRTRSSGGSGLGLAIVDAIVQAHGGLAVVLPTPGGGATFEVALPARTLPAPSQEGTRAVAG
jgi:two-component system OmpR family sensor kinase